MESKPRIIVAHAERQHSFYLATAVKKKGYLYKYITTIYDRPQALTGKIKKFLHGNILKKALGRKTKELSDEEIIQFNEVINLFITFLAQFTKYRDLCRRLRNWNSKSFGLKVAKYAIKHNVDAVIMFDGYAYRCFEYIKKYAANIKCILDVTIISRPYMQHLFDEISEITNDNELQKENFYLYDQKFMSNYLKEYTYSDYFLAASKIVKMSIKYCGISKDKIMINPYGVDINKFFAVGNKNINKPLHLIVVGQLSRRKGIHQLLNVISKYSEHEVVIDLVGGFENTSDIYIKYKKLPNVKFYGFVTHDKLFKLYQEAHVFVLPSLAEGMALVGLEALASGLPLLCSNCTGINDLVIPYKNGIITRAGYEKDIKNGIDWYMNHMDNILDMGKEARMVAENYTWNRYYQRTLNIIDYIMKN